jgi:hypothetical protein
MSSLVMNPWVLDNFNVRQGLGRLSKIVVSEAGRTGVPTLEIVGCGLGFFFWVFAVV